MTRHIRNEVSLIPLMREDVKLLNQRHYERHQQRVLAWRKRSIIRRCIDTLLGNKPPVFLPFSE